MPEAEATEQRLRALEQENQRLRRKLARSEQTLERWHRSRQQAESLLSTTIQELQTSQTTLKLRSQELEQALADVQSMQARLLVAEKMSSLGVLVAGIAHEINNPVSFIYGNITHMEAYVEDLMRLLLVYKRSYPTPLNAIRTCEEDIDLAFLLEDLPKTMQSMRIGAERIERIVLSLRTFSRMDEADHKTVDIHTGLESTLIILSHRLKETNQRPAIQVTKRYADLPPVACYAGQINQVFMNVLVNAIDALEEARTPDAEIEISTSYQAEQVSIVIADNGPGIPEKIKGKIFDPFFTTKSVGKGTGMGMAISYQIVVDRHHGQLLCDPSPKAGAQFTICLPLNSRPLSG
ncbi:MAG: ATP-binding protein [Cyanobacteria bacterium P01_D01_bin.1]